MAPPTTNAKQPEIDVLILSARKTFCAAHAELLERALREPVDWSFILDQAQRHCVLPFLYANLNSHGVIERVPLEVRRALESCVRGIAAHNLSLVSELVRLLRHLERSGVGAIPFKGPVVAAMAYGDQSLRAFADLDILVDPEDLSRARTVLGDCGYEPTLALTPGQERDYINTECAVQLRHRRGGFVLELHWRLFERNASLDLPLEAFRSDCGKMSICGAEVTSFSAEDLLLYLCAHGAKHCWERLEWITCVAELVGRNPGIDWETVLDRARRYRIHRTLLLGLWLSKNLFDAPLPRQVASSVESDPKVRALGEQACRWLFLEQNGTHYENRAARYKFLVQSREDMRDRFRILLYSVLKPPHPAANEWIAAPHKLSFLNHLTRPARLLREFGGVAWRKYSGTGMAVAMLAALALFSLLPEPLKGRTSTSGMLHQTAHLGAFCVVFLIVGGRIPRRITSAGALALGLIMFGALLEFLQSKVYGNYLEYWDIRSDAVGVLLGLIVSSWLPRVHKTSQ